MKTIKRVMMIFVFLLSMNMSAQTVNGLEIRPGDSPRWYLTLPSNESGSITHTNNYLNYFEPKESQENNVVYPNPASSKLYVFCKKGATIKIITYNNKVIFSRVSDSIEEEFDVSLISKGIYIVLIKEGDIVKTYKIIIN